MLTTVSLGLLVLAAVSALALLLAATAAPAIRSGRSAEQSTVPLVAPRGAEFGDATAIVAACAHEHGAPAAVRTTGRPRGPRVGLRLGPLHHHAHA